ncbi:phosphoadenosine phosphosulfate reductase family protein [Photorhabdus aegyptia]|uniref:PAPS reductase/FAD synthetase family protein n=1 Tax=Photorhabdus aegyptia TaxID=2805098 RepID=A0A022PNW5_9GAMM|nr:phosphoadenosine phosphosulfate reductase family protein [Photorhabdus aegyptia]EYU16583.1 PAPS reductase/FAD synthetase family protein [Photorhabdus aegyptia]
MQQSFDFNPPNSIYAPILTGDKWDTIWQTLASDEDLNYVDASADTSLAGMITTGVSAIYNALIDGWTISLAYSSGKDSEVVLHLFLMALMRAKRSGYKISQYHFVQHTDTRIENPEVRWLADTKLAELEKFIQKHDLPLTIIIARPGLTSSWTGRILTGRGLPTFSNSNARQCTNELKVSSARRAKARYMHALPKTIRDRVCLLLGSRDAESTIRANNIAKKGGSADKIRVTNDGGELYPIRHWLQGHIWEFLLSSGSEAKYPLPSYLPNNNATAELYKAATGECVWSGSQKHASEACGSRFGCWACQAVRLDKSMENLLRSDEEKYAYMLGLNRIQRFLSKRRYAWEDRHPVGRTIYEGGFIKIQPDVYSPRFLDRLLHICCSVDYVEQKRAEDVMEKLLSGQLEDNEQNRRMAEPQFRIVSEEAIVHIDFMWSFHHFNEKPFRALEIYRCVWAKGELDLLEDEPDMPIVPKQPIPKPLWLKVGKFGDDSAFDGLSDPISEMTYFDGDNDERVCRTIKTSKGLRRVMNFVEDDEVTIDEDAASFIIWVEYPRLKADVDAGKYTPGSAAQFYLRYGAVALCKGKAAIYHRMMQRGQTYHRLGLSGVQTMEDIAQRKDLRILTTDKYQYVLKHTLKARIIRFKWWVNLAFTIEYHLSNMTSFGLWLSIVLQQEERETLLEQEKLMTNQVLNAVTSQTSAWCLLVVKKESSTSRTTDALRRSWRKERSLAYTKIQRVPEQLKPLVASELYNTYRQMLFELNTNRRLSVGLHAMQELAQSNFDALRVHIRVIMRIIRQYQNAQNDNEQGELFIAA